MLLQVTVALGRQAEGYGCVGSGKSSPFGSLVPVDLFGSKGNGLLGTGLLSDGINLGGNGGLLNLGGSNGLVGGVTGVVGSVLGNGGLLGKKQQQEEEHPMASTMASANSSANPVCCRVSPWFCCC